MSSTTATSIWNIEHKGDILEFTEKLTRYEHNLWNNSSSSLTFSALRRLPSGNLRRSINRSRRTSRGDRFAWRDRSIASNGKHCLRVTLPIWVSIHIYSKCIWATNIPDPSHIRQIKFIIKYLCTVEYFVKFTLSCDFPNSQLCIMSYWACRVFTIPPWEDEDTLKVTWHPGARSCVNLTLLVIFLSSLD